MFVGKGLKREEKHQRRLLCANKNGEVFKKIPLCRGLASTGLKHQQQQITLLPDCFWGKSLHWSSNSAALSLVFNHFHLFSCQNLIENFKFNFNCKQKQMFNFEWRDDCILMKFHWSNIIVEVFTAWHDSAREHFKLFPFKFVFVFYIRVKRWKRYGLRT